MRQFVLILFSFVILVGMVGAADTPILNCDSNVKDVSTVTFDLVASPHIQLKSDKLSESSTSYTACHLSATGTDISNLGMTVNGKELTFTTDGGTSAVSGKLLGFNVAFPSGASFQFTDSGVKISLKKNTQFVLNNGGDPLSSADLKVLADGGDGDFVLSVKSDSGNIYPGLSFTDTYLVVGTENDVSSDFYLNGYYFKHLFKTDSIKYGDNHVNVVLNKQETCSSDRSLSYSETTSSTTKASAFTFGRDSSDNYFILFPDEKVCNFGLTLPNNYGTDVSSDFKITSGLDSQSFSITPKSSSEFSFILNKGDTLKIMEKTTDEKKSYTGEIAIGAEGSSPVPVSICGNTQYQYGGKGNEVRLTKGTKFSFTFQKNIENEDTTISCPVTSCVYYGDKNTRDRITVWCNDKTPAFQIEDANDLNGLQYENGKWLCIGGNCFESARVNLYPFENPITSTTGQPSKPFIRLDNGKFESYEHGSNTLTASQFFIGGDENYKIKPSDKKVTLASGSLIVNLQSGDFYFSQDNTKNHLQFVNPTTITFDSVDVFVSLNGVNCCDNTAVAKGSNGGWTANGCNFEKEKTGLFGLGGGKSVVKKGDCGTVTQVTASSGNVESGSDKKTGADGITQSEAVNLIGCVGILGLDKEYNPLEECRNRVETDSFPEVSTIASPARRSPTCGTGATQGWSCQCPRDAFFENGISTNYCDTANPAHGKCKRNLCFGNNLPYFCCDDNFKSTMDEYLNSGKDVLLYNQYASKYGEKASERRYEVAPIESSTFMCGDCELLEGVNYYVYYFKNSITGKVEYYFSTNANEITVSDVTFRAYVEVMDGRKKNSYCSKVIYCSAVEFENNADKLGIDEDIINN